MRFQLVLLPIARYTLKLAMHILFPWQLLQILSLELCASDSVLLKKSALFHSSTNYV